MDSVDLKKTAQMSQKMHDCIDFGLFFKNFPGGRGEGGGGMPLDPPRLRRRSIDSSTRKNFPLFSQQSVTGYDEGIEAGRRVNEGIEPGGQLMRR